MHTKATEKKHQGESDHGKASDKFNLNLSMHNLDSLHDSSVIFFMSELRMYLMKKI